MPINQKALKADLLKELDLDDLPEGDKFKFVEEIGQVIQQNIMLRVLQELSPDAQDQFDTLLANAGHDPDAVELFLRAEIPKFDDIVLEEIAAYKEKLLKRGAALKK